MRTARYVVLTALLLAITFGVVNSQGASRKHSHGVVVVGRVSTVTLPPGNDPTTGGIVSVAATCPKGTRATGGGYESDQIVLVPVAQLFPNAYGVVAANLGNNPGTLKATVECIRTTTTANAASATASLSQASIGNEVEQLRSQRRTMEAQNLLRPKG